MSELPSDAAGLRLCRIDSKDRLILCETVMFTAGRSGIDTVLRRAAISGRFEIGGENHNHFADVMDAGGSMVETVALDAKSYSALKTKWMRCRVEHA